MSCGNRYQIERELPRSHIFLFGYSESLREQDSNNNPLGIYVYATMHGQKRSEYKSRLLNPETSTKLATKAQQWNHLSNELLTQRRRLFCPSDVGASADGDGASSAEAAAADTKKPSPEILLSLTEKMLSVNPDPSHLWNAISSKSWVWQIMLQTSAKCSIGLGL